MINKPSENENSVKQEWRIIAPTKKLSCTRLVDDWRLAETTDMSSRVVKEIRVAKVFEGGGGLRHICKDRNQCNQCVLQT